jgi:predicted patatin/cPLA2 family phospholipase
VGVTRRVGTCDSPRQHVGLAGGLAGDDEVLRALLRRQAAGGRADSDRIALAVSGGGMRGAYAGGMVHALSDAGLAPFFDVVYGSSAGAFVGAGLLLDSGRGSAAIFYEDMACREFIDPRRFPRRPLVSLDHLLDDVLVHSKPLDWDRLHGSPVPLRVVATALDDLSPHVLEPGTPEEWKRALRATASIPLLAGPAVELHGRRWIDGSVGEPLPVLRALADGATHVLALFTRAASELRIGDPGAPAGWARALDRLAPGLGHMAQEARRHAPVLAVLGDAAHPSRDGVHLLALLPERDEGIRGLTTDAARVERAAQAGYAAVVAALARVRGAA